MIDMHQDLLSVLYYSYKREDYSFVEDWIKSINVSNVSGLIANLYFMSDEEMRHELGDNEKINVVEMFEVATNLFKKYLPDIDVIYSIEGCDYINSISELEKLYDLGLRNILLVWNCPNKYGSGNRGDYGLTDEGKNFITRAVELGISIDLSHMNKNTFYDTVNLLKSLKSKNPKVIVSHSNCYELCNHVRNLDDDQILALKDLDAIMGLVAYEAFVSSDENCNMKEAYLEHIKHVVEILGIDHIGVSTDDMTFGTVLFDDEYPRGIFNYESVRKDMIKLLSVDYNLEEIEKILYKNIYNKLFRSGKNDRY